MERIIIREVDNTSNVEALSSYDVAYVPGFALGAEDTSGNRTLDKSLYRIPTLCRDKYEFLSKFGPTCPTFSAPQPYPSSFPGKAIKWGSAQSSTYKIKVNYFDALDDIQDSGWYTRIYAVPTSNDNAVKQYYVVTYDATTGMYELEDVGANLSTAYSDLVSVFGKSYFTATFTQTTVTPDPDKTTGNGEYEEVSITEFAAGISYFTKSGSTYTEAETYDATKTYYVFNFSPNVAFYTLASSVYTQQATYYSEDTYYSTIVEDENTLQPAKITEFASGVTYYEYKAFENSLTTVDTSTETTPVLPNENKWAFSSNITPSKMWYTTDEATTLTSDAYIDPDGIYWGKLEDGVQPMFNVGDADPGYRYALTLLSLGMPVYFEQMNDSVEDINVSKMYAGLNARFVDEPGSEYYAFDSMGDYNVKFITSGGYPTFEYNNNSLAEAMRDIAKARNDSIALIDHTDNPSRPITTYDNDSIINAVRGWNVGEDGTFATMFTPWYECTHAAVTTMQNATASEIPNKMMPGSLAYLTSLAIQIQNYNPWLAVSGVTRGLVPYCKELHTDKPLTNQIADSYQALPNSGVTPISINPLTYVRNYGICIWGNRTLRNNANGTKASSFLNIRSAVSDIKKRLYEASQQTLFEQNTDVTWLNYKSLILPLLETMVSDYILQDYAVTRLYTDPNTGFAVPAYEIMAVIRIQPINSVEVFDLTIYMENTDEFTITTTES